MRALISIIKELLRRRNVGKKIGNATISTPRSIKAVWFSWWWILLPKHEAIAWYSKKNAKRYKIKKAIDFSRMITIKEDCIYLWESYWDLTKNWIAVIAIFVATISLIFN